ncbi:MAG: hypothetical protein QXO00_02510 [Candidatus Bathyarchaeia archaeon]
MTIVGSYEFNLEDEYDPVMIPTISQMMTTMMNFMMLMMAISLMSIIVRAVRRKY